MEKKFYHLEIESDPKNLITVEEFINYFAVELNLSEDKINALLLSVTEAVTNAIKHGNKNQPNKLVTINVTFDSEYLTISIKDQGEGFNPNDIPDPTHPENLLKDSGRGVYLMKIYMDEIYFNKTNEGMETILKLKLN
ncbi:MAG: ATP-binding protein [Ignavibacterium sp.]|nr:ATP-binding protein [Ignavibacterium sp.]MCX7611813.1 ATP-binding protein [Ignavibacterium sp.]MDW8374406.1 ATP-binding protein [Ignavibacteriales bacterium]